MPTVKPHIKIICKVMEHQSKLAANHYNLLNISTALKFVPSFPAFN